MSHHLHILGFLLCLVASGCQAPISETLEVPTEFEPLEYDDQGDLTLSASIHPDLPEYSFTLVGRPVDGVAETLLVTKIEIQRVGKAELVQVIDEIETETPVGEHSQGIEVLDMNFDGYGDIRIVEFVVAGANIPYLNWLFDPASERFVRSEELDSITSPEFDTETRHIRSNWRDGAARYGTYIYEVIEGRPVLVRKELNEYLQPGVYERTVSQRLDGVWKVVEQEVVRE